MTNFIGDNIEIVYEDEALLVINKPSGLIVNRSNTTDEKTLQDYLQSYLNLPNYKPLDKDYREYTISEVFNQRFGLAHRLDKHTSGVLLIGKTPESLANLMAQFKNRTASKEYLALVHGVVEETKIEVQASLGRNPQNRFKFAVVEGGKSAKTLIEKHKVTDSYTLVKAYPKTGRTHQVRVHLAALNHPIVADRIYGLKRSFKADLENFGRLMLHARKITINHPVSGNTVTFTAELPLEFTEYY